MAGVFGTQPLCWMLNRAWFRLDWGFLWPIFPYVCVCALVARRKWWIQHKICCRCVSLTRYETLNSSLSDNNALAREKRRKKNEPEENAMQQQQQQLRTKKVHHGGGSSPATNEEAEEESTMKTRAMKSLCKQAQNECRVVIAGALLILPKDLVLIVRFAGLVSRLLSHSLRSSAYRFFFLHSSCLQWYAILLLGCC